MKKYWAQVTFNKIPYFKISQSFLIQPLEAQAKTQSLRIHIAILFNYMIKIQFFLGEYHPRRASSGNEYELHTYKVVCWTMNSLVLGTGTPELKAAEACTPKGGEFCRKPFVIYIPLSDLVYLNVYLGMLYFAVNWCFILETQTGTIKWKQHFENLNLTQLHLEAYQRSYLPYTSNGGRGVPLETCTENLIPSKLSFSSVYWLNRGLSKIPPLQLSSWTTNRKG